MILILTRMFNPVHNLRKMNRYKIYAAKYSSIVLAVIAVALACGACTNQGGRASGGDTDSIGVTQRPDTLLIDLAHSIAGSDASGFAARCSYPITREYPLRDIVDSAGMVRYFPVIFDDSLKSAFARMTPGDWESYGWRGWSPKENNELWVDDKVYAVNYHSKAENALRADDRRPLRLGRRRGDRLDSAGATGGMGALFLPSRRTRLHDLQGRLPGRGAARL